MRNTRLTIGKKKNSNGARDTRLTINKKNSNGAPDTRLTIDQKRILMVREMLA